MYQYGEEWTPVKSKWGVLYLPTLSQSLRVTMMRIFNLLSQIPRFLWIYYPPLRPLSKTYLIGDRLGTLSVSISFTGPITTSCYPPSVFINSFIKLVTGDVPSIWWYLTDYIFNLIFYPWPNPFYFLGS